VALALEEVKADYTSYTVNVMDKPQWYVTDVNPVGKVRSI
jgi:glutathione S-transferase